MDNIITEEFTLTLQYAMKINTETGEILETKLIKRSVDKSNFEVTTPKKKASKPKKEEVSTPQLILEDNKYCLNAAAVELMQVGPDSKLDIKYEKRGNQMIPVIGTDEAFGTKGGNKLTKSNTVACRGSKNEELSKYGTEFTILAHDSKEGLFILSSGEIPISQEELNGDENIALEEDEEPLPLDIDLPELVDDKDANVTEIDANFFKL